MKGTWYLHLLCFALAVLGISLDQTSVPNQEIVIRFTDSTVTPDQTEEAIARVKGTLETLAADNIRIQEAGNGILKVTYYSAVDVDQIKTIFSEELELSRTGSLVQGLSFPESEDTDGSDYELGVYKIQEPSNLQDLSGNILELKSEAARFTASTNGGIVPQPLGISQELFAKSAFVVFRNIALAIDRTSYKIPEVRAGPRV